MKSNWNVNWNVCISVGNSNSFKYRFRSFWCQNCPWHFPDLRPAQLKLTFEFQLATATTTNTDLGHFDVKIWSKNLNFRLWLKYVKALKIFILKIMHFADIKFLNSFFCTLTFFPGILTFITHKKKYILWQFAAIKQS